MVRQPAPLQSASPRHSNGRQSLQGDGTADSDPHRSTGSGYHGTMERATSRHQLPLAARLTQTRTATRLRGPRTASSRMGGSAWDLYRCEQPQPRGIFS